MHKPQYEFLSALYGTLLEPPKKARLNIGGRGKIRDVTLLPGRILVGRMIILSAIKHGWITVGTQYAEITEAGVNAVCDYRKRFNE